MQSGLHFSYYDQSSRPAVQRPKRSFPPAPKTKKPAKELPASSSKREINIVARDRNWSLAVGKEKGAAREWKRNWSFLADHGDSKGSENEVDVIADKPVVFPDRAPNTTSGEYGAYLNLEPALSIQHFEQNFNAVNKRKRLSRGLLPR